MDSDSNERFYKGDGDEDDSDLDISFDNDALLNKRRHKPPHQWSPANTYKLIDLWKRECRELWDPKHPTYRDRSKRVEKQEYLAGCFETTPEEINRKLHNLRSQYNNELRKMKKKRMSGVGTSEDCGGWEYFEALTFLVPTSPSSSSIVTAGAGTSDQDPLEFNVAFQLAEFQAKEEEQFKVAVKDPPPAIVKRIRVANSRPPPLPPHANPMLWPEEPIPNSVSNVHASDECQIFGDFVASELRSLKSDESRKKLKRIIQKAILEVGEDEDLYMMSGEY